MSTMSDSLVKNNPKLPILSHRILSKNKMHNMALINMAVVFTPVEEVERKLHKWLQYASLESLTKYYEEDRTAAALSLSFP